MSLILCRQESVENPYYFEDLGVHLYSSQELCYAIYNNPVLVLDGFVNEDLIAFIRRELDMEFLAGKLEKWMASEEDRDELLPLILQECDYYKGGEINHYRQELSVCRKMAPHQYARTRADYLFGKRQYGKSVAEYERIVELKKEQSLGDEFLAGIYYNLGSAYARLFMTDKACQAYEQSFDCVKNTEVLKRLCYLMVWNPSMELSDRFQSLITDDMKKECEEEVRRAEKNAADAESVGKLDELFLKDPIKRWSGAGELVQSWKQEYRNMI